MCVSFLCFFRCFLGGVIFLFIFFCLVVFLLLFVSGLLVCLFFVVVFFVFCHEANFTGISCISNR